VTHKAIKPSKYAAFIAISLKSQKVQNEHKRQRVSTKASTKRRSFPTQDGSTRRRKAPPDLSEANENEWRRFGTRREDRQCVIRPSSPLNILSHPHSSSVYAVLMHRYDTYRRTPALKPKPKTQGAIIADILLEAEMPLSFHEIVTEAKKANYEDTFKQGRLSVPIEDSIEYHLERTMKSQERDGKDIVTVKHIAMDDPY
jgi:hypothetical protein